MLAPNPTGALRARAGDCFVAKAADRVYCLPHVVNIGVQKAGTGELQTWLNAHPHMLVHGGEAHFFDRLQPPCHTPKQQASLRLRYARFLWRRHRLDSKAVTGITFFEKTPAYFDMAEPRVVACAVPDAKLLLMLRMPVARAISAYRMCQEELNARWCTRSFDAVLAHALSSDQTPRLSPTLQRQMRRLLLMGQYAEHLHRWLVHFRPEQLGVIWVEQFKRDPFKCMDAMQRFLALPSFDYRKIATRNAAGYWVVGKSKSSVRRASATALTHRANKTLHAFYEQSQHRLRTMLAQSNLTLVFEPPPPLR
uniref:Sulfotransferase domain-containing protein n=1 Tax=Coccolithus braarudii TaxID=221442 RepID=A0A7S0Q1B4_9EUKA|mmetsp:Transcript_3678/g.7857  ORF Transcript_3678/g.7857 Transcript_3678/m.7857 type:complete len:309 (+) Transcript_3678:5-931(+)